MLDKLLIHKRELEELIESNADIKEIREVCKEIDKEIEELVLN